MYNNAITSIEAGAFNGLTSLQYLYVQCDVCMQPRTSACHYRFLDENPLVILPSYLFALPTLVEL